MRDEDGSFCIGEDGSELACGRGPSASGQTKSLVSGEQKSLILSYKYHFLCSDKPGGVIVSGKSDDKVLSQVSLRSVLGVSLYSLMETIPGEEDENSK